MITFNVNSTVFIIPCLFRKMYLTIKHNATLNIKLLFNNHIVSKMKLYPSKSNQSETAATIKLLKATLK